MDRPGKLDTPPRPGHYRSAVQEGRNGWQPAPKTVLRLPDLDQAKSAVLNSLSSTDAQRGYWHAIEEFIEWYCSEPRLSFSKSVVLRYRIHLESASGPGYFTSTFTTM